MAESIIGVLAVAFMEVMLGVDNVLFLGILAGQLSAIERKRLWRLWLFYSPLMRLALLFLTVFVLRMEKALWTYKDWQLTWRGLILIAGGLFLMYKATKEIFSHVEEARKVLKPNGHFVRILGQAILVDLVFSVDSVLTAVGLSRQFVVMVMGIGVSILVMAWAAQKVHAFLERHPSFRLLGLAFLLLIGFMLFVEGAHLEVPRGYVYFAMFFSFGVEVLQLWHEQRYKQSA